MVIASPKRRGEQKKYDFAVPPPSVFLPSPQNENAKTTELRPPPPPPAAPFMLHIPPPLTPDMILSRRPIFSSSFLLLHKPASHFHRQVFFCVLSLLHLRTLHKGCQFREINRNSELKSVFPKKASSFALCTFFVLLAFCPLSNLSRPLKLPHFPPENWSQRGIVGRPLNRLEKRKKNSLGSLFLRA